MILHHLSQCHLGVQLDLCIFGALPPSQHRVQGDSVARRHPLLCVVGVVTSCVPWARVRGRTSRSCATENTYIVNLFLSLQYDPPHDTFKELLPIEFLVDSSGSTIQAYFVLLFPIPQQVPPPMFIGVLQSIAAGIGISNSYERFS